MNKTIRISEFVFAQELHQLITVFRKLHLIIFLGNNIDTAMALNLAKQKILQIGDFQFEYDGTAEFIESDPVMNLNVIYHDQANGVSHIPALDFFAGFL